MIAVVALVAGLAGLWVWVVLNDEDGIARPVNRVLDRWSVTRKWMTCPWCGGAWFAIAASVALHRPDVASTVVTALAAAAVTGLIGSYLNGE